MLPPDERRTGTPHESAHDLRTDGQGPTTVDPPGPSSVNDGIPGMPFGVKVCSAFATLAAGFLLFLLASIHCLGSVTGDQYFIVGVIWIMFVSLGVTTALNLYYRQLLTIPTGVQIATLSLLVFAFLLLPVVNTIRGPQVRLSDAVATADRIVVRDGGFDCCGSVDDEAILFETTDPGEIKTVLANLECTNTQSPCKCCGFPGIDWYEGKRRLAVTAIQHGKAIRWGHSDWCLSETSREWIVRWLVKHGVSETEIDGGCGGPRRNDRREKRANQTRQVRYWRVGLNEGWAGSGVRHCKLWAELRTEGAME